MNLLPILINFKKTLKSNSPEILTAFAVSGVVTTSYLAAKASFKAAGHLEDQSPHMSLKDKAKYVWKCYIPTGISGALTIGCIVGASKSNSNRAAAAVTAYSLTEKAFTEYREKIVEQIGKGKEQNIRDEVAQDKILNNPLTSKEVVLIGPGQVLCCELFTRRYFRSDMETLRKAINDINMRIVSEMYVTLDEFYDLIGLPGTSNSDHIGWDSNKLVDLYFSTVLSESGEPCLSFDYNYTKPLR
jgi:hypothetical protein